MKQRKKWMCQKEAEKSPPVVWEVVWRFRHNEMVTS